MFKKLSKSKNSLKNDTTGGSSFLTPSIKIVFNYLQLVFIKALIFWNFDLRYYIWIKTNALGYVIDDILS